MRRFLLLVLACAAAIGQTAVFTQTQTPPSPSWLDPLRADAARLTSAALADDFAWQRLAELTDTFGNRLSGSENLERAIEWAAAAMRADVS